MKEAAEQSGRGMVPKLHDLLTFDDVFERVSGGDRSNTVNFFCDKSGSQISEVLNSQFLVPNSQIGVWIGPEGGWSEEELHIARLQNCKIVSLGKTTLRAETAAIIATYAVREFVRPHREARL